MRKAISLLLTFMIVLGLCPAMAVNAAWDGTAATSLQGNGKAGDPYLISNAAELKLVSDLTAVNANNESEAHYKLTADIDLEGKEWIPISNGGAFAGNFDGDGYVVKNFKITTNRNANGFFYDMDGGAEVYNLGVENATIAVTSGSGYLAGVFSGRTAGEITNCYVKNSSVTASSSLGTGAFTGGVRTASDVYTNCYAYNVVVNSTKGTPGGFFSYKDTTGQTFKNCYVAEVTSNNASYYGFGLNIAVTVKNCYTTLADKGVTGTPNVVCTDKDTIVSALVTADSAYASQSSVNGGYPYLKAQKNVQPEPTQAPTPTPTPAPVLYGGGSGTEADPYLIETAQHLATMNTAVNSDTAAADASYKLMADIDFGGNEWLPLGRQLPSVDASSAVVYTPAFTGTFDGNGHVVKNIRITIADRLATTEITSYTGFFGRCEGATVKNLGIDGMIISVYNHDYQYAEGKKIRSGYMGAMAGAANYSSFTNCYVANSSVRNMQRDCGDTAVGGFIGAVMHNNTIENCYAYNTAICAGQNAVQGGFFGYAGGNGTVFNNCFAAKATHNISGTSHSTTRTTTYGFGCSSGKTVTATDCYSTLADSQGNHFCASCVCHIYNKSYSVGKTAMTAEALLDAVLGNGVYLQDRDVNGGYPYLSFEKLTPADGYTGGSGTEDDPFLISNASELLLASNDANSNIGTNYYFKLTNDIDYSNNEWTPIGHNTKNIDGTTTPAFMGGFDGDGHVIRNIRITNNKGGYHYRQIGFFGYVTNATIKDLGIENIVAEVYNASNTTTGERIDNMAGLAGMVSGATKITNCYIKNSSVIQMQRDAGENGAVAGFVGTVSRYDTGGVSYYPTFENCYVYNTQLASGQMRPMGGFFGRITYGGEGIVFRNCYVAEIDHAGANAKSSHPTTTSTIYGFGNTNGQPVTIDNCYTTLAGSTGNHTCNSCVAPSYNSNYAVGDTVSEDVLKDAFEDTDFVMSDDINDGYPHISFETAVENGFIVESVQPGITKVTAESYKDENNKTKWTWTTEADETVSVVVKKKAGVTDTAKVYVASYNSDGRLIGADSGDVTADAFKAEVSPNGVATVKVFVWNGDNSPVAKAYAANPDGRGELIEAWEMSADDVTVGKKTRLVLMGDSIVDNVYHDSMGIVPRYGWEGYIGKYLNDDITLIKHGHGSQTVKDFIVGRNTYHYCDWTTIKKQFGEGDYVLLALGHNDEKAMNDGLSADKNFTVDEFKNWYKQIIADVKAKGAKIILLTPTPENGSYENGQYYAPTYKSRTAILELAEEADVDVIDMTQKFADKLNKLMADEGLTPADISTTDPNARGGLVFVDRLHMGEYGADLLARTVAEEVAKLTTGLENFVK